MAISSPGIGSNLDVNGIVAKLMSVEAQPLNTLEKKANSFQAKISALGTLSGGISSFQSSLSALTSISSFQSNGAISNNTDIMVGSATSKAVPGTYKVNVTQIAQAQTLVSAGKLNTTSAIGLGASTTISFQLGTVSGGSYGLAGSALPGAVISGGIANGSLTINGTAISTDAGTKSAKALAEAINAKNATTGVSATAQPTQTSATLFGAASRAVAGHRRRDVHDQRLCVGRGIRCLDVVSCRRHREERQARHRERRRCAGMIQCDVIVLRLIVDEPHVVELRQQSTAHG